jgi:hypothetical protein
VSLNPPLNDFPNGVLMESVITMSSAFLDVLSGNLSVLGSSPTPECGECAYMADSPEPPGVMCLRIEESLSAILKDSESYTKKKCLAKGNIFESCKETKNIVG